MLCSFKVFHEWQITVKFQGLRQAAPAGSSSVSGILIFSESFGVIFHLFV